MCIVLSSHRIRTPWIVCIYACFVSKAETEFENCTINVVQMCSQSVVPLIDYDFTGQVVYRSFLEYY